MYSIQLTSCNWIITLQSIPLVGDISFDVDVWAARSVTNKICSSLQTEERSMDILHT